MAEKKNTETRAHAKASKPQQKPAAEQEKKTGTSADGKSAGTSMIAYAGIAVVVIAAVAVIFYLAVPKINGVPFSVFKSSFTSSKNVALVTSFNNGTEFAYEYPCMTKLSGVIGARQSGTLDFMFIDRQNSTCLLSTLVLPAAQNYHGINESNETMARCMSIANSEPSIFLNYSATNHTTITTSRLYVYGNSAYFQSCPIAVDVS